MENQEIHKEDAEKDRMKGYIFSIAYLILAIGILLLPILIHTIPPPGQPGVLVSFGFEDGGADDTELASSEVVEEVPVETPPEPVVSKPVERPASKPTPKVVTAENPDAARLAEQKKIETERRNAEIQKQKAEAAAAQKKLDEQKKYEDTKSKFGDMLSKGKGNKGSQGNLGDPSGDSTGEALKGTSTGVGVIGGGLNGRGLSYSPKIQDNTQKSGKVVVKVCVNATGEVVSAEYTQAGSTTTDIELRNIAVANAKKFKFSPHTVDKQCGTISIDFRLK